MKMKTKILILLAFVIFASLGFISTSLAKTEELITTESSISNFSWEQTAGPFGGSFNLLEISPADPNIILTGSWGGLFRSVDAGASWKRVKVDFGGDIFLIIFDQKNPKTVYATAMGGLFRSTDSGLTWIDISGDLGEMWPRRIMAMGIDPTNEGVIYIGISDPEAKERTIYKTQNGGKNWFEISKLTEVGHIAVVDSSSIYAGGRYLYHSKDGGKTWKNINVGQGEDTLVSVIKVDPIDKEHIFIGFGDAYNRGRQLEELLFETYDGGKTWTPVIGTRNFTETEEDGNIIMTSLGRNMPVAGSAVSDIEISPTNNKLIYYLSPLHRSKDGGKTWEPVVNWNQVEDFGKVEQNIIAIDPKNDNILYATLMGQGVAKSTDGGETWWLANNGLLNTIVTNIVVDPENPATVYISGGDGSGTWKTTDRGKQWTVLNKGGITHPWVDELAIDPQNPNVLYQIGDIGKIFKSTDGGTSWKPINKEGSIADGFMFSSTYALAVKPRNNPEDSDTIYALNNGFGLFKSGEEGSWNYLLDSPDYSYSIAIDPSNPNRIYSGVIRKFFETSGQLMLSGDGGESWKVGLKVPGAEGIKWVEIDPSDSNRVYAGSIGDQGEIYISDGKGVNWQKIEGLTLTSVNAILSDYSNPNRIYAGTKGQGTFKSEDGGKTWKKLENAPSYVYSLKIDPTDPSIVYLGDGMNARFWKSTNYGETWEKKLDLNDKFLTVKNIDVDPKNPNNVYAAICYCRDHTFSQISIGTIYKSGDRGETWREVNKGLPNGAVTGLIVDPKNPNIVYAGLDHEEPNAETSGVFKSTDYGKTWKAKNNGLKVFRVHDIQANPDNPSILYVPMEPGGVFKSVDGGDNWQEVNTGPAGENLRKSHLWEIVVHPKNYDVLYVVGEEGVFFSTDAGETWRRTDYDLKITKDVHTVSIDSNGEYLYIGTRGAGAYKGKINPDYTISFEQLSLKSRIKSIQIAVAPDDSNVVYISVFPGSIFKSTDRGKTWFEVSFGLPNFVIEDPNRQGYYSIALKDSRTIYVGAYGQGVYRSINGGEKYWALNGEDMIMKDKHIMKILVDPKNPDMLYVAAEEGVFKTENGGKNWFEMSEGLPTKDVFTLAIGNDGKLYAGHRGYGVFYYDNPDKQWRHMGDVTNFGVFWSKWDRPLYLYNALLIHPFNPDVMYFGTFPAGFYKTTDGGKTWHESNRNFTIDGAFALTFHPYNKNIIYAGTYNGVSKSENAGRTWRKIDVGMPPEQWPFSIVINPANPNIIYAATKNGKDKGFCERHPETFCGTVLKSLDGGESWFEITRGLYRMAEFYSLIIYPYNYDILFLSASNGAFITFDGGEHWLPINKGLEVPGAGSVNNVANNMKIDSNAEYLYLGTAGGGAFRANLTKLNLPKNKDVVPLHCFNYKKNFDEKGPDCGGSCAIACKDYIYGVEVDKVEIPMVEKVKEVEERPPEKLVYVLIAILIILLAVGVTSFIRRVRGKRK